MRFFSESQPMDSKIYTVFILCVLSFILCNNSSVLSSEISIKNNHIYANNMVGVRILGGKVIVQDTHIYNNGRAGVIIKDGTDDTLIDQCVISYNKKAGINIDNIGNTRIHSSHIYHNDTSGIQIANNETSLERKLKGACYVDIQDTRIYMNNTSGVRCGFSDTVEHRLLVGIKGCTIEKNKKSGIIVEHNSALVASENKISLNGMAGITTGELGETVPTIDVYKNIISENDNCGINAQYAITTSIGIRNNLILNNGNSGIRCKKTPMMIANNTIINNGNKFQGVGIEHLDTTHSPSIVNNILAYNHITGSKIPTCSGYSYNLYYNNGGAGNCCNNCDDAPYSIEHKQIGGCRRGKADLICNPLFTAPEKHDFSLSTNSVAIDAGCEKELFEDRYFPPSQGTPRNDMGITGGPYAIDVSVIFPESNQKP
ncbi:MAG: right-handed parallel beta-helix repeat-containing protein [bacterium]